MQRLIYIAGIFILGILFVSCEKKDYPKGLAEYEHHYYIVYVPNNNSLVSVQRTQTTLLKLPLQFYSEFTRDYDAVAQFAVVTDTLKSPAQRGVDFEIVDKNGTAIQPVDGLYSITFPQAKKATDTIYVKLLNNPAPGTRKLELRLKENKTSNFYVDIFSTACNRPIEIK